MKKLSKINPFRTAKQATNGNHGLCLKSKPQVNLSLKLPSRINFGRRGAHAELSTLDTAHKLSRSHERVKAEQKKSVAYKKALSLEYTWQLNFGLLFREKQDKRKEKSKDYARSLINSEISITLSFHKTIKHTLKILEYLLKDTDFIK